MKATAKKLVLFCGVVFLVTCQFTGEVRTITLDERNLIDATWIRYSTSLEDHEYDRLVSIVGTMVPGQRQIVIRDTRGNQVSREVTRWPYDRIERARQLGYMWANQGGIIRRLLVWFDGYFGQYTDHEFVTPHSYQFSDRSRSGTLIGVTDLAVDRLGRTLYVLAHYRDGRQQRAVVHAFSDSADTGRPRRTVDVDADGESLEYANRITVNPLTRNVYVSRDNYLTMFNFRLEPVFTGEAVSAPASIGDLEADVSGLMLSVSDGSGSRIHLFKIDTPTESWSALEVDMRETSTTAYNRYALASRRLPGGSVSDCEGSAGELWAANESELQRHYICR